MMKWAATSVRQDRFSVKGRASEGSVNDQIAADSFGAETHFAPTDLDELIGYDAVFVTMWKIKESFEPRWMDIVHKLCDAGVKVVLFQEAEVSWPLNRSWEEQQSFFELLGKVEIFLTHNTFDIDLYQPFRKGKPIVRWRTCLDIEKIVVHLIAPEYKPDRPILFGSSFDGRANGLTGLVASMGFGKPLMHQNRTNGYEERGPAIKKLLDVEWEEIPYAEWGRWLRDVSKAYVAVHPMPAAAAGRDQIAFAALGIPCVGYSQLALQRELFPSCSVVDPFDIESIRYKIKQLLVHDGFYAEVSKYALERVMFNCGIHAASQQVAAIERMMGW